ncbi:MAG: glycosyltransferase [Phycisphaerales bacterium]|nr:glycosyltransferase [Phycisphaerales bacterium]
MSDPPRLLILADFAEERWPSMDLCARMLFEQLQPRTDLQVHLHLPKFAARWSRWFHGSLARNADRLRNRMKVYPTRLRGLRDGFDLFHLVDHSYSQLLHELPPGRTGVFCHDLDTFACLLRPGQHPRPAWFRRMTRRILQGFQKSGVVFHSTDAVRQEILSYGLIDPTKLVKAPLGIAPEFFAPVPDPAIQSLVARPYLLHVGSCIPRKRIDLLLTVFAAVSPTHDLRLIQVGGQWTTAQARQLAQLPPERVTQVRDISRAALAWLYHRARLVLLPSDAEGFGLPLVEALAAGAVVVASDIPVLREVAGPAAVYCPAGAADAWIETVDGLLSGRVDPPAEPTRREVAHRYTWAGHAATIASAYLRLAGR